MDGAGDGAALTGAVLDDGAALADGAATGGACALLIGDDACGAIGINGLMWVARRRRLRIELCDLRNSGDTAGGRDEVVGYGAFALYEVAS